MLKVWRPNGLFPARFKSSTSVSRDPAAQALVPEMQQKYKTLKSVWDSPLGFSTPYNPHVFDGPHMRHLVAECNRRNPGLNVHYANSMESMMAHVAANKSTLGTQPMRFVAKTIQNHHTAWEFRCDRNGKLTAIGLDPLGDGLRPGRPRDDLSARTVLETYNQMDAKMSGVVDAALLIPTGVQSYGYGCEAICEGLVKTLGAYSGDFGQLHERVGATVWAGNKDQLPLTFGSGRNLCLHATSDAFGLLPTHAYKNSQSRSFLQNYFAAVPGARNQPINAKGETIEGRLWRLSGKSNPLQENSPTEMAFPADMKRMRLYGNFLDGQGVPRFPPT
jgi:hypothetical protein